MKRFPLIFVAIVGAALLGACGSSPQFPGRSLDPTSAPDFTLTDQNGKSFSLGQERGRVVVLTFMYTHCPDVCPAMAGVMSASARRLGKRGDKVTYLAVSVDPENDTAGSAVTFTRDHQLDLLGNRWHFGLGARTTLEAIWRGYGIGAEPSPSALVATLKSTPGAWVGPEIDHNAVMYLIDRRGQERALVRQDVTADQLTSAINRVLDQ